MDIPSLPEGADLPAIRVLEIWRDHEPVKGGTELVEVHWVKWAKKGTNAAETVAKISRLEKHYPQLWAVVQPAYEHWLKGQEEPIEGTPLTAWPAVTPGQVEAMKLLNLRSVEDVAGTTDADFDRMGPGSRGLRDKARAFVEAKKGEAVLAERLSERDAEVAEMKRQIEELVEANAGFQQAMAEKRGPGRPRKMPGDVATEGIAE